MADSMDNVRTAWERLADAKAEIERLKAANAELLGMLRRNEWAGPYGGCPCCVGARDYGHKSGCEYAKLLAKTEAPPCPEP